MKHVLFYLMISILMEFSYAQNSIQKSDVQVLNYNFEQDDGSVLNFYRQYSSFTDPGKYAYLYENLPDSLPELCSLIKSQFIHPYAELPRYRDQIPEGRQDESSMYPTVKSILEGLLSYDTSGLVNNRKPENRLILGCRHNAILLASILKYHGIPARVRAGHATYIIPDFHTSHTICEVWNEKNKRWMLVDPSMGKVDFSRDKFDSSYDAWLKLQKNEIDPNLFGMPGQYPGVISIVGKVCTDLASILGTEYPIYQYSPILDYAFENDMQLTLEHIETLNRISELMKSLDADNLSKLQEIYNNTPQIQITKQFETITTNTEKNTSAKNLSIKKPIIEFVNIPGGTFMMGSPNNEEGRKDDEIQHEVTLSALKMSKYCVTYEQYDLFCEATGRETPWGFKRGNMPVSQVTWFDANAFAEWMGCRLPTEAKFEYAARANTTTPFYTGDCITSAQANFNGIEPYTNCEKSENKGKPLLVGSFPPNAFGLYDMHGNMLEWISDWYSEYIIENKLNPKGPKTDVLKVARGGGWFEPTWKCRSAYRGGGIPPGNRGAGISFRIVKDE
ncbi:MAG: SUMF1/EgtB/PvdO family nonheme iron enzyme [Mariniphaga sp.]|nr:SUMF1/EgtB/PvdO family nonheme iron enzyme [Mariniphaga sp.]